MPVIWNFSEKRKLARARHLVSEGSQRLVAHQETMRAVRRNGRGVPEAERLLATLLDSQIAMVTYLARQERAACAPAPGAAFALRLQRERAVKHANANSPRAGAWPANVQPLELACITGGRAARRVTLRRQRSGGDR